jgi:hypothetical protein
MVTMAAAVVIIITTMDIMAAEGTTKTRDDIV